MSEETKVCCACHKRLTIDLFSRTKPNKCKPCYNISSRAYRAKNRAKKAIVDRRYRNRRKDNAKAFKDRLKASGKYAEYRRREHLKKKYKITLAFFDEMIANHNNQCAICNGSFQNLKLNIDHNHITGVVRGLLCNLCNTMIGMGREDQRILLGAINYLNKYNGRIVNAEEFNEAY